VLEVESNSAKVRQLSAFQKAIRDGRAWAWASKTYDPDAHDTILGVQNTSRARGLRCERLLMVSDTASQIQVFVGTGVTIAGTAVVGVALNRAKSGDVAAASAAADETGNGAQAAGYTGAVYAKLFTDYLAANIIKDIPLRGILLPYGTMIGVDLTTAATAANAVLLGWFE
jgi:hypothetical protein